MNLDAIIAELEYFEEGVFPRKALQAAIAHQQDITPILLKALDDAANDIDTLIETPNYNLHTYALYLLAQFKEPKAYPLILKLFTLPDIDPYDFSGDFLTEALGRVLGSVYDGNFDLIKQIFKDETVNEYVRSALLDMVLSLVAEDVMSREEALKHYQEFFSFICLNKDSNDFVRSALASDMLFLCPDQPILDTIEAALHDNLVDTSFVDLKSIQHIKTLGVDAALQQLKEQKHYRFIQDTIAEMEGWHCFQKKDVVKSSPKPLSPQEIWQLTSSESYEDSRPQGNARQSKKKSKAKKSPLREAQGFSAGANKKKSSSKKKKRSKT